MTNLVKAQGFANIIKKIDELLWHLAGNEQTDLRLIRDELFNMLDRRGWRFNANYNVYRIIDPPKER